MSDKKTKILIFDSMHPIPVSMQLDEAFKNIGVDTCYLNGKDLKVKPFYKLRRGIAKKLYQKKHPEYEYYFHAKRHQSFDKIFREFKPDIVLVIGFFYSYLDKEVLLALKEELKFKLVLYDTDSGNMLPHYKKVVFYLTHELPAYDQIFSFSRRMVDYWQGLGFNNVSFCPYGSKTLPERGREEKKYDICFVGNPEMRRVIYLEQLKQHNIIIYGEKWKKFFPLMSHELTKKCIFENIWGDSLYQLLNQSKIILNINISPWQSIESGVNLRVFEVLAAKGFLLTDYCEELGELFKLGEEIETFKTMEELHDKVAYYLSHDKEREQIAKNGYQRFLESYTWEKRASTLLDRIRRINGQ